MDALWQVAFSVAGLGGVSAFVLWSLYRGWLKLPIFQTLEKEQLYKLLRLFLILTFLFAAMGLAAWVRAPVPPVLPSETALGLVAQSHERFNSEVDEMVSIPSARPDEIEALSNFKREYNRSVDVWLKALNTGDPVLVRDAQEKVYELFYDLADRRFGIDRQVAARLAQAADVPWYNTWQQTGQQDRESPIESGEPRAIRALWDLRYGHTLNDSYSRLPRGRLAVRLSASVIGSGVLDSADVFIIAHHYSAPTFSETELAELEDWVASGGVLVCAGQAWHWVGGLGRTEESFPLNQLGDRLGFTITGMNAGAPAAISDELEAIGLPFNHQETWWPSRVRIDGPGSALVWDVSGKVVAAKMMIGEGYAVALGHGSMLEDNIEIIGALIGSLIS